MTYALQTAPNGANYIDMHMQTTAISVDNICAFNSSKNEAGS